MGKVQKPININNNFVSSSYSAQNLVHMSYYAYVNKQVNKYDSAESNLSIKDREPKQMYKVLNMSPNLNIV
jgi:hypothetical protein